MNDALIKATKLNNLHQEVACTMEKDSKVVQELKESFDIDTKPGVNFSSHASFEAIFSFVTYHA